MPVYVPLDRVQDSPFQSRRHYDEGAIEALADSIERDGQLQNPVGRLTLANGHAHDPSGFGPTTAWIASAIEAGGRLELAYGHRRARAWRLVWQRHEGRSGDQIAGAGVPGLDGVPVGTMPVELQPLSDEAMFAKGVSENRHRRDLSGVEEAEAMHAAETSFGWTHEQIGQRFGYSRSAVSNKLRLLKLPADVRELNVEGLLAERTARALVAMYDLDEDLRPFADAGAAFHQLAGVEVRGLLEDGWTHERIAHRVQEYLGSVKAAAKRAKREREPEMFSDEPDNDAVAAEVERINGEHNRAVGWITSPDSIPPATTQTLTRTVRELTNLTRQIARLDEPTDEAVARDLDRLSNGVRFDIDRCQRELDRRGEGEENVPVENIDNNADGYDDDGEELKGVAEAREMEPFDEEREAETGEEMEPADGDTLTATRTEALRLPEPVLDEPHLWSANRPVWPDGHEKAGKKILSQEIFDLQEQHYLPLLDRYGVEIVSRSNVKEDLTRGARRAVRFVSNLRCAYALDADQLEAFTEWAASAIPDLTKDTIAYTSYGSDSDVHRLRSGDFWLWKDKDERAGQFEPEDKPMVWAAALVLAERQAVEDARALTRRSLQIQKRFDEAFDRLAASFVYHLFHAAMSEPLEDLPDVVRNQRERKLYRAVRDGAAGEGHEPRRSDEKAADWLVSQGALVSVNGVLYLPEHAPADTGEDVTQSDADEPDEEPDVSAETPGGYNLLRQGKTRARSSYFRPSGEGEPGPNGAHILVHDPPDPPAFATVEEAVLFWHDGGIGATLPWPHVYGLFSSGMVEVVDGAGGRVEPAEVATVVVGLAAADPDATGPLPAHPSGDGADARAEVAATDA